MCVQSLRIFLSPDRLSQLVRICLVFTIRAKSSDGYYSSTFSSKIARKLVIIQAGYTVERNQSVFEKQTRDFLKPALDLLHATAYHAKTII